MASAHEWVDMHGGMPPSTDHFPLATYHHTNHLPLATNDYIHRPLIAEHLPHAI